MRYQDQLVKSTQKALEDVIRAAEALPADRLEWSPAESARSALSQMQEIAVSGRWFLPILREGKAPAFDDHARKEAMQMRQSQDTLEKCKQTAMATTSELCQEIAAFPDDRLEEEIDLPFGGGVRMTMADVLGMHAWNMIYHLGQINYLQTILGDRDMH